MEKWNHFNPKSPAEIRQQIAEEEFLKGGAYFRHRRNPRRHTNTKENRCVHDWSSRPYSRWSPLWRFPDPRLPTKGIPTK